MAEQLYSVSGRPQRNRKAPKLSPSDFATSQPPPKQQSPPPPRQSPPAASLSPTTTLKVTLPRPVASTSAADSAAPPASGASSPLSDLADSPANKSDAGEPHPPSQPASPTATRSRRSSTQSVSLKVKLPAREGTRTSKRGRPDAEQELTALPTVYKTSKRTTKKPKIQEASPDGSPEPGAPEAVPVPAKVASPVEPVVMEPAAAPVTEALVDKVVAPEPAPPPKAQTSKEPTPPPERPTKRPSKPLDPSASAFKPKPSTSATHLERTQSASGSTSASPAPPTAAPAPTSATALPSVPKKSLFAVDAANPLKSLRKKPGAGAAGGAPGTPSVFAPKASTPLGRPKPAGAAGGAAAAGGKADDKGGKIWANLVGKGQLPDAKKNKPVEPAKPKKPVLSPAERLADAARRRQAEKDERQRTKKDAFDLLEQSIAMSEFETKYRHEVQQMQRRLVDEEGDRFPLPRLTTYGSVFSIWPRETPAAPLGEAAGSEQAGAGPMEVV